MTADKLRRGMYDYVRAVLNGANEIGSAEGVVNHEGQTVPVRKRGKSIYVGNVAVGISKSFNVYGSCVLAYCAFDLGQVVDVYKGCADAERGERVGEQIVASAVYGLLSDDVTAVLTECLEGVTDCGGTRRQTKRGNAALKCGNSFLKGFLCGVCESALDVTRVLKTEASRGVCGITKYV